MLNPFASSTAGTDTLIKLTNLEQILDRSPLIVTPDMMAIDAIVQMNQRLEESPRCILVVERSQLVGIFTERDVVELVASGVDLSQVTIAQVMAQPATILTPETPLQSAIALSTQQQIYHFPIVDTQGNLIGLVTRDRLYQALEQQLQQELDQRQQLETALQDSQRLEMEHQQWLSQVETTRDQVTTILESITDGFIAFDRDWHFTYVNAQAGRILQRNPADLIGKFVWSEFPNVTNTAFYREYHRAVSEQVTVEFEEFYPPLDTWFAVHAYLSANGLVAYFQDITARKRVEEELRAYAQQVEDLYNQAPCGYHSLDQNGVFVQMNDTELEWLGYSRDEVIGRKITDFLTPESLNTFEANFPVFRQEGWVRDLEFQMIRKDGTILPVLVSANAIRDEAGNYVMSRSTVYDISDRKRTEAALRESEARYRSVVTAMREGIVLQDRNGNILECNASAESILGLSRDQMLGRTSLDSRWRTIHEDGSPFPGETHPAMVTLRTGQPCSNVMMGVHKPNGVLTWISINSQPLLRPNEKTPYAVVTSFTDISERKQTEDIFRNLAQGVSAVTGASFFDSLVQYLARTLGTDYAFAGAFVDQDADQTGQKVSTISVWSDDQWRDNFEYVLADTPCQQVTQQTLCLYPSQVQQQFPQDTLLQSMQVESYAGMPLVDSSGRILGLLVVMHRQPLPYPDRAASMLKIFAARAAAELERQQAEQKIREQAALLDITSDAIFVRNLDHQILYWNQGAERLYGWQVSEAMGQNATELLQEDTAQVSDIVQTLLQEGHWQGEIRKVTKSGREVIVEGRWTLVRNDLGHPKFILTVNTDITEKKQLEAQFLRAQRLESIGTLASGIAHDLNNILTPVLAVAQLLPRRVTQLDESTQRLLEILETNVKRGGDLVKQILSFARGSENERRTLQIGHLLTEITKISQQTFPKSIEIRSQVATQALWLVRADATQLHQVIMNLCVNARDAMPDGGQLKIVAENCAIDETFVRMHIDAQVGAYVKITIADTGTGIVPAVLDKIFDPFFTTKAPGQGTGLGLSTVLTIVKQHGGFLDVSTQVNRGTRFSLYLPAIVEDEDGSIAPMENLDGNDELILVVDDEIAIGQTIKAILEAHRYQVLFAQDGIDAVSLYVQHKHEIRMVLLDLMMPFFDGFKLIATLLKINPKIQIVAMSGLVANEEKLAGSDAVQAFLSKPFTTQTLLQTVHQTLAALSEDV